MRIYTSPIEAFREVERDLWEMGIHVHTDTYQDKDISGDEDMATKEVQAYGFSIVGHEWTEDVEAECVGYLFDKPPRDAQLPAVLRYINAEFRDRTGGMPLNPGNAWSERQGVWSDFLTEDGTFHYTYSERIAPQLFRVMRELEVRPDTRQAIINIHSNILPIPWDADWWTNRPDLDIPTMSQDLVNMGGSGRVPCSMYYQLMIRKGKVELIYTMRSCDFLTHFGVDVMLALRLQAWVAASMDLEVGRFTYFAGSLHAFVKDMRDRGIF